MYPDVKTTQVEPQLCGWAHSVMEQGDNVKLYLGPQQTASLKFRNELVEQCGIKAIVNATNQFPNHHSRDIIYCRVAVDDNKHADLLVWLDGAADFVHTFISQNQSVLVHCQMGRSRSSTIAMAYLIKHHGMNRNEAYCYVKKRRPQTKPNSGFWIQLGIFEQRVKSGSADRSASPLPVQEELLRASLIRHQTVGHLKSVDSAEAIGRLPNSAKQTIYSALDLVFGRGCLESDLRWLAVVCQVVSAGAKLVEQQLLDTKSDFHQIWAGGARKCDIDCVLKVFDASSA